MITVWAANGCNGMDLPDKRQCIQHGPGTALEELRYETEDDAGHSARYLCTKLAAGCDPTSYAGPRDSQDSIQMTLLYWTGGTGLSGLERDPDGTAINAKSSPQHTPYMSHLQR